MIKSSDSNRIRILGGIFIFIAMILISRLYFIQVIHGDEYSKDALSQYVVQSSEGQGRGNILFTAVDGTEAAAAIMQSGWRIAITPKDVRDAAGEYEALSKILEIDKERFINSVRKENDPYEEVAFRVADSDAARVRALKLPGVITVRDSWRMYPAHSLGAQTIGFVGFKGDEKIGVYGLERQYDEVLNKTSRGLYVNPFAELFANVSDIVTSDPASREGDVVTTLDPNAEQQLTKVLTDVMKKYTPIRAGGIVMDPHTGAILAMAVLPSFDPNTYNLVSDPNLFANQLVEGRYELGSIMKPLTVAAAIDAGTITTETTYNDAGCIERSGRTICNFDHKARHVIRIQEILSQSLNVGATFAAESMGHDRFAQYMRSYGFGERTQIDLPNEVMGDIHALDRGSDVDYASASFGQGIAVSPIEMIRALSTLANGGIMPTPHVVKAIRYESGIQRAVPIAAGRRVLKAETADTVTGMLIQVVDKALLKGAVKQEHYSIAAKTGTAQIGIPGGGGYYADRYLHSFFGYFPAHNPRYIVFLYAVEPHGVEYASASLAQPFMDLATFLIHYLNIPPDR